MKRNTVIAVALSLMMIATATAGADSARQDENLRQAGQSSVYFYDVAPTDTRGKGTLMVDVNQHTFVFNGQDFEPSAHIALGARAAGSDDYVIFATGKPTPSGNLHIAGTWEAAAAPADVLGSTYYPQISGFCLDNYGWFVAKVACYYSTDGGATWTESDPSAGVIRRDTRWVELCDLGVPVNSLVKIHVVVVAGNDRTGSEVFQSVSTPDHTILPKYAWYRIDGTTLKNSLAYMGSLTWGG